MFGTAWLLGPTSCLENAGNVLKHIPGDKQLSGKHFGTKIRSIGQANQKLYMNENVAKNLKWTYFCHNLLSRDLKDPNMLRFI